MAGPFHPEPEAWTALRAEELEADAVAAGTRFGHCPDCRTRLSYVDFCEVCGQLPAGSAVFGPATPPAGRMDAVKFRAGLDAWGVRLEDAQALEREHEALRVLAEELAHLLSMARFHAQTFSERQAAALKQWDDMQGFEGDVCAWSTDHEGDHKTSCGQEFGWEGEAGAAAEVRFCWHCGRRVTHVPWQPEPEATEE